MAPVRFGPRWDSWLAEAQEEYERLVREPTDNDLQDETDNHSNLGNAKGRFRSGKLGRDTPRDDGTGRDGR